MAAAVAVASGAKGAKLATAAPAATQAAAPSFAFPAASLYLFALQRDLQH
jgi:hypothetical protein